MQKTHTRGAWHTPQSMRALTDGTHEDKQIPELLRERKHGLAPVEAAILTTPAKLDRLMELANPDADRDSIETQADQIQALLENLLAAMEVQAPRLEALERFAIAQDARLERIERLLSSTGRAPVQH